MEKCCGSCKWFSAEDIAENGNCPYGSCNSGGICDKWEAKEDEPVDDDIKPKNEMVSKISSVCADIEKTLISKNTDYGNSFQETLCKYGDVAFMVRLDDKFARLNSLFNNQSVWVKDESFEDTVRDIAGYCLLFLAIKKEEEK